MRKHFYLSLTFLLIPFVVGGTFVFAQTTDDVDSAQVQELNQAINDKKGSIQQINDKIAEYQKQITKKQSEKASLAVELELLDNRIAKTKLEIEEANASIDLVNSEIALLQQQLLELESKINLNKTLLTGVLQEIQTSDQNLPLNIFFGSDSLSELFDDAQALEMINQDLKSALDKIKQTKQAVEDKQSAQELKRTQIETLQIGLEKQKQLLEEEVGSQSLLIAQTQRSEDAFRKLLQDLKQEQASISQEIQSLQKAIESKLNKNNQSEDGSLMSWPIDPSKRGLSATFHDLTYPFRHLFEHPGIDLPAPTGTSIKSAAAGYVAWTRKGTQYGNYVMVIHANGLATLYAHMSRIDVKVDQFIPRGGHIGAVGSTGLSTGPHLHFEVRKDGIPTNPISYLVSQ